MLPHDSAQNRVSPSRSSVRDCALGPSRPIRMSEVSVSVRSPWLTAAW